MIAKVLDLLWPRACEVCQRPVDRPGRYLCADCLNRLPFIGVKGCCRVCGRELEGMDADWLCDDCRGKGKPCFDRAASAVRYETDARLLIRAYKFRQHLWLKADLTDWLEGTVRARFDLRAIDVVLPVPTGFWARVNRGYAQCAYLAKDLAKRLEKPYAGRVLKQSKRKSQQAKLTEDARHANVQGVYSVAQPARVKDRTVLLVDDILTTGSTLSECARVLKAAGARQVWCITLARSLRT